MNLYETHIPVSDVARSIKFYEDVLGLELAFEQPQRNVAFLWIGSREKSMLGLWGPGSAYGWKDGDHFKHHFAIAVTEEQLFAMTAKLQALGIKTRGFTDDGGNEPSVIGWMPSAQIYFPDPDGHSLELITILDDAPDPDFFGSWSEWKAKMPITP